MNFWKINPHMWFWDGQKMTAHLRTATSGRVGKTSWRCSELPSLWFPNRSDGNLKAGLTTRPSWRPSGTAGQLHASSTEKWGAKRSSVGDGPGLRVWVSARSYSARSRISSRLFVCFSLSLTFELASQVLVSLEPFWGGGWADSAKWDQERKSRMELPSQPFLLCNSHSTSYGWPVERLQGMCFWKLLHKIWNCSVGCSCFNFFFIRLKT